MLMARKNFAPTCYPVWLWHSQFAMERSTMLLIDKPYISKGHRNPMANCQCHNQRVTFVTPKTWAWNKMIHDCPICSYWKLQFLGGSVVPWFHMKFACGAPIWARLPILHVGFERQPILIDFTGTSEWIPWVFLLLMIYSHHGLTD